MNNRILALNYLGLTKSTEAEINKLSEFEVVFNSISEIPDDSTSANILLTSPEVMVDRKLLERLPDLKYIGLCGSSTANIDIDSLQVREIKLSTVEHYGDEPTAEFIFAQITNLLRGIGPYQWKQEPHELMGKTVGIIGLGSLGGSIASLALAYKMDVRYYGPNRKHEFEGLGVQYNEKNKLLSESDIVVLSGPGNLVVLDDSDFSELDNGTIIVQASQGSVLDEVAFVSWIEHQDNYAIFDYAAGEKNYKKYSSLERIIFPKIVAGHSIETRERLSKKVLLNLQSYIKSQLQ